MFLRGIRLRNFRSFPDTGHIELRPIVVLVGANSSGKSSLLRFFPLLRQTYQSPSRSPLLWYGDDVDFGNFSSVLFRHAQEKTIGVELEVEPEVDIELPSAKSLHFSCQLAARNGHTAVLQSAIKLGEYKVTLVFGEGGTVEQIAYDDVELIRFPLSYQEKQLVLAGTNELIPHFDSSPDFLAVWKALTSPYREYMEASSPESQEPQAEEHLDSYLTLFDLLHISRLHTDELSRFSKRIRYVGPFRHGPQRHYRKQELIVSQIEAHGQNLAMFLEALPEKRQAEFAEWTAEYFGFRVHVSTTGDHVNLLIEQDGAQFNLVDMGYGISQVLPIVTQCWAAANGHGASARDPEPSLIAIEQPELHLHPRYQERLADMFTGMARSNIAPHVVIETHSEVMINRFGELAEEGTLNREDIVVYLVQKDPHTGTSTVTRSEFDEKGVLTNWPIGFFAP